MDRFEEDLRRALGDRQPPSGFAARVLSRVPSPRLSGRRWFPRLAIAGLALSLLVTVVARYNYRQQELVQAERAKQQVLQALRITRDKLQPVQDRLRGLSDH